MTPLWDLYRDGLSQSLLSKFEICRHRFWLYAVCGFEVEGKFPYKMEYGNMFHNALEVYQWGKNPMIDGLNAISRHSRQLRDTYLRETQVINKWTRIALNQFEVYTDFWRKNDAEYESIFAEQVFEQPYEIPSGRIVKLRGKWDGGVANKSGGKEFYLWENKIKGEIDDDNLGPTLAQNIQVQYYLVPLFAYAALHDLPEPSGVVYNLVRRPLSFGKHNIKQKKGRKTKNGIVGAETESQYHHRLKECIQQHPKDFFVRYKVAITREQIDHFRKVSLDPMLEQICDWWESIRNNPADPFNRYDESGNCLGPNPLHYRRPFGVWDSLAQGLVGDFQNYLTTGSTENIKHISTVFPELEN